MLCVCQCGAQEKNISHWRRRTKKIVASLSHALSSCTVSSSLQHAPQRPCEFFIIEFTRSCQVIVWTKLGGKPNWPSLNFGCHDVICTPPPLHYPLSVCATLITMVICALMACCFYTCPTSNALTVEHQGRALFLCPAWQQFDHQRLTWSDGYASVGSFYVRKGKYWWSHPCVFFSVTKIEGLIPHVHKSRVTPRTGRKKSSFSNSDVFSFTGHCGFLTHTKPHSQHIAAWTERVSIHLPTTWNIVARRCNIHSKV